MDDENPDPITCAAPNCDKPVLSEVSYHILCEECGDQRRRAYAKSFNQRQEEEE